MGRRQVILHGVDIIRQEMDEQDIPYESLFSLFLKLMDEFVWGSASGSDEDVVAGFYVFPDRPFTSGDLSFPVQ